MPGKPITLGPFSGGMNLHSDPSMIDDSDLVDSVNFEVDLDGSLVSRPPFQTDASNAAWTQRINIIGSCTFDDTYLFGSNTDGTWYFLSGTWTLVTDAAIASCVVQYNDAAYFMPYPGNPSISLFKWTPDGGYVNISPPNLAAMMGSPLGGGNMAIYKERLFIVPGPFAASEHKSRLWFSNAGAPEFWESTSFIDVNPGDGQELCDLIVQDDNLVLFKRHSTYVLTYTSAPSDAELLCINKDIGVQWVRCVIPYENTLFVLHNNRVYEVDNYTWTCITIKTPLYSSTDSPSPRIDNIFMSRMGDRLIVRLLNIVWVYQLRTKAWGRWESQSDVLHNFGPIVRYGLAGDTFYAGSSLTSDTNTIKIVDGHSANVVELENGTPYDIVCTILTKNYDLEASYRFKRLNWWGLDAITFDNVTGSIKPVIFGYLPSWGDLNTQGKLWSELEVWGSLQADISRIETTIDSGNSGMLRRFMRFPHSIRFRQVNFAVVLTTSGSTSDGPVKIFTLTAFGSTRQVVPNDIN